MTMQPVCVWPDAYTKMVWWYKVPPRQSYCHTVRPTLPTVLPSLFNFACNRLPNHFSRWQSDGIILALMVWASHCVHPINSYSIFSIPWNKRRMSRMYAVWVGHLGAGGAEDECPLPSGRLITASGMGLLPNLPKTALSPQQKLPLHDLPKNTPESDVPRCRRLVGPAPLQQ